MNLRVLYGYKTKLNTIFNHIRLIRTQKGKTYMNLCDLYGYKTKLNTIFNHIRLIRTQKGKTCMNLCVLYGLLRYNFAPTSQNHSETKSKI